MVNQPLLDSSANPIPYVPIQLGQIDGCDIGMVSKH